MYKIIPKGSICNTLKKSLCVYPQGRSFFSLNLANLNHMLEDQRRSFETLYYFIWIFFVSK